MFSWQPWQNASAPDACALQQLGTRPNIIGLLGNAGSGERGRFGFIGMPHEPVGFEAFELARIVNEQHPFRILLLPYEFGFGLVDLPCTTLGMYTDLKAVLIVDHVARTLACHGDAHLCSELLEASRCPLQPIDSVPYDWVPLVSDIEHQQRIQTVQQHIAAGDIYQANLTRPLHVDGVVEGALLAIRLLQKNPVPHAAYVHLGDVELVSNSMETLLTHQAGVLASYPIKGTARMAGQLEASAKDQAEHVMIVDLIRNDLGRVGKNVQVTSLMAIESYYGVKHGVSRVTCELERSLGEAVAAIFPGGSITGAPKRRAMQILNDVESTARGFYTGSLGILWPNGQLSMSILIRTLVRRHQGEHQGAWHLPVGGAIVADSCPIGEIQETWDKVEVFRRCS
jgi:anthranilate/para-aminobenzoate synthase component I